MKLVAAVFVFLSFLFPPQDLTSGMEKTLVGVYQGEPIFIQNPYQSEKNQFCVAAVYVNDRKVDLNYRLSALKVDFKGTDLFTPVSIKITYRDSLCSPEFVNPRAVFFHTSYKFLSIELSDSALYWTTEGERETGIYTVEKLQDGIWIDQEVVSAEAKFEFTEYIHYPQFEEGPNKYRIKYDFGNGRYLYSSEVEYEHYPDPVEFEPFNTNNKLTLSRSAYYEVFNQKSELVLSGTGIEVDVRYLRPGDYVIYFDRKQPASFRRNKQPPPRG